MTMQTRADRLVPLPENGDGRDNLASSFSGDFARF